MEEVLEKAAALKKAKKAEKKKRQKLKNGKVVLSDEDYAAARAIQGESAKVVRRERYLAAKSFKVPDDVSLRQIQVIGSTVHMWRRTKCMAEQRSHSVVGDSPRREAVSDAAR